MATVVLGTGGREVPCFLPDDWPVRTASILVAVAANFPWDAADWRLFFNPTAPRASPIPSDKMEMVNPDVLCAEIDGFGILLAWVQAPEIWN